MCLYKAGSLIASLAFKMTDAVNMLGGHFGTLAVSVMPGYQSTQHSFCKENKVMNSWVSNSLCSDVPEEVEVSILGCNDLFLKGRVWGWRRR